MVSLLYFCNIGDTQEMINVGYSGGVKLGLYFFHIRMSGSLSNFTIFILYDN
jgi:hypothetical protein